ncbi:hypothetical protein DPEC_G00088620 [Dallia pectoralis]|uniref:Uncharacterized protein n=1 Tax=Dallia pectoralis TaxID=75939 RepID=A0ACC2H1I2_DALPE|nr:hypothetical protein DPEC_G00088620 [Dallia pectoralis]
MLCDGRHDELGFSLPQHHQQTALARHQGRRGGKAVSEIDTNNPGDCYSCSVTGAVFIGSFLFARRRKPNTYKRKYHQAAAAFIWLRPNLPSRAGSGNRDVSFMHLGGIGETS